jgi:hypothetical protein
MLHRRLHLRLGPLLLIIAVSGPGEAQEGASAGDRHHAEQCGGYYACIEHEPWQMGFDAGGYRSPADTSGKASDHASEAALPTSGGWVQHDREE